ncbi:MAG TPA: M48 family metallopeptidase [Burkholderiales bacterium]|nr:M48 family metallopeptidase [Burkholderiales bacterium]
MRQKIAVLAALAALGVAGCQTVETTKGGAVGVDRQQRMAVSAEEVNAGAQKAYAQMMAEAQKKGALDRDPAQVARVKTIVSKLVPQTTAFRPDAAKWPWEVHVISIDEVNAWCMPAGKMAIYTGLINKLGATDDEIAAVMGHEIAHALREHSREQMSQQVGVQAGIGIVGALFGIGELGQNVGAMVADVTMLKPKSRAMETESDRIGVELAARAGYNPMAAVSLWEKMAKVGGGQPPQWLSTHPSHERRIADLKEYATKVMPLYAAAKGGSAAVGGTK